MCSHAHIAAINPLLTCGGKEIKDTTLYTEKRQTGADSDNIFKHLNILNYMNHNLLRAVILFPPTFHIKLQKINY